MNYWRERNQPYQPGQTTPFKVSRTKIELFSQCQRCFWLDARLKIKRPSGPPFNINKVIDELFKKEFDTYRAKQEPHPLMAKFKVDAIPFAHEKMDEWRENFVGVVHVHKPTNLHVFGAVDDIWVTPKNQLMVVDYKGTAKDKPVTALGPVGGWQDMYRRQMEVYQWLLKQNGFDVSDTGYFVYTTTNHKKDAFDGRLDFETHVFPHHGGSDWVDGVLVQMKECLESDTMPPVGVAAMGGECEHCAYARSRTELTLEAIQAMKAKK